MVYSVIVVPGMLGKAGFPPAAVFVATCLVAGFGSLLMGVMGQFANGDWLRYFLDGVLPHSVWYSGNKLAFLSHWAQSF